MVPACCASQGSRRTSGRVVVASAAATGACVTGGSAPMAPEYTLYCFAQSGNAYKAALMLAVTGTNWTPRFVDYFGGETSTPAYRAINVMGEVPVLEHKGERLTQSGVMLDYVSETLGQFGPANAHERREIWRWILWDNHKLTSYTATLRFLRTFTKDADPAVIAFLRGRAQTAWGVLNTHLARGSYVVG